MTLRHCWLAIARRLACCGLVGALLLAIPAFAGTAWAEAAEASPVDSIKTSLDEIEATIAREDVTAETLAVPVVHEAHSYGAIGGVLCALVVLARRGRAATPL